MHNQTSNTTTPVVCPSQDQSLFNGSFSGRLRELALGSSRSDALSAIRTSKLRDWKVDDSSATLETRGTKLVFAKQPTNGPWVTAVTPHGEFALPHDHWIAQQILRRLDRRTTGFGLEYQNLANHLLCFLEAEAYANDPRSWEIVTEGTTSRPLPMSPTSTDPHYGNRNFVKRLEANTQLGEEFTAKLVSITWFGVRTEAEAVRDYLHAGPYTQHHLQIEMFSNSLDTVRGFLGLARRSLAAAIECGIADTINVLKIWEHSGLARHY